MAYFIGLLAVCFGVFLDQFTKHLATIHLQDEPYIIIKDVFQLRYLENRGAAFGMLQNKQLFFVLIGILTLVIIFFLYIRMPNTKHYVPLRACMITLTAGAIGNMIDRVRLEYVVDFFYFELIDFPIFNVADIFATCSTIALVILFLFYYSEEDMDNLFHLLSFKKKTKKEQE